MLVLGVTPEKAPDKETEVTMTFEQGVPKTLNGKEMKVSEIITELNKLGGENGIGIVDIVENRVVGMKSRGVYAVSYTHLRSPAVLLPAQPLQLHQPGGPGSRFPA